MPLQISGKLSLPITGTPAANAQIRFRAVTAVGEIIPGAESIARCDASGNYSISIEFARYELATKISTPDFVVHGQVTINASTSATDLEDLISIIGIAPDLSDELIAEFLGLKVAAESASASAKADAEQTAQDRAAVSADKLVVDQKSQQVSSDAAMVSSAKTEVLASAQQVASDAAQVAQDAAQASSDAASALASKTDAEASAASAKKSADDALYNANQTFISGGLFTPSAVSPYPDTSGVVRDTVWIVEFPSHNDSFTYTSGDLNGITVANGDLLFYDTPQNIFKHVPTSISGVLSVNGMTGPDVTIVAADIGALPVSGKAADSLLLNGRDDYYNPDNKPTPSEIGSYTKAEIDKIKSDLMALQVGNIEYSVSPNPKPNQVPAKKGVVLSRASDSILWQHAQSSGMVIAQSVKDSDPFKYSAYYGDGDGTTTFTPPDLHTGVFLRGRPDSVANGEAQTDAIRNITGEFSGGANFVALGKTGTGALMVKNVFIEDNSIQRAAAEGQTIYRAINFDASRVVPTADENRPKTLNINVYINRGKEG